jgi:pimeloyl-ACP methyl ester carboxylesterase
MHSAPPQPADWQADLDRFRAVCRLQRRAIGGHDWDYILRGGGARAVLILPGGLAIAETAFRYIQRLERRYRVLAPTYPETIMTMAGLVDGLARLLDAEQLAGVSLIGGSYSGLVAQCFLRRVPARVEALVLADTGVPRRSRALQMSVYRPLIALLPLAALRGLAGGGMALFARKLPAQRAFWLRYFKQRIAGMTRAAFASHLSIWRDFDRSYRFAAQDLAGWRGQVLIVEAEHDGLFRKAERSALRALYPAAQVHTFERRSHGASLAYMDDYIARIEQFLAGEP